MTDRTSSGMKNAAISAMFTVLMLLLGWVYADGQSARSDSKLAIDVLRVNQSNDRERIATLEEGFRGMLRQLDRIEASVNEVKTRVNNR